MNTVNSEITRLSEISQRLREERLKLGLNQEEFGQIGGVKKNAQHNYEVGKRLPDAGYLAAISKLNVDVLYILTGRRELSAAGEWTMTDVDNAVMAGAMRGIELRVMRETAGEERPVYTVELDDADFAAIPRVDARLAAGGGAENHDVGLEGALAFRRDWLRERDISPSDACLLKVTGDSMAPTLHDGDLVMIDERRTAIRNRHVYAFVDTDGAARVKRVELIENELILLTSDNPTHPSETRRGPDMNRLRILGEIVWSAHAW